MKKEMQITWKSGAPPFFFPCQKVFYTIRRIIYYAGD
jgi:hypothetical protein